MLLGILGGMKAKFTLPGLMLVFMALLIGACKKNEITGGGYGGSATLHVAAQHMARDIDSCMIYIKYNATEAPKLTGYDDSAWAAVKDLGRPLATFSSLTTGNYFLFAKGYDPVYQQGASGSMTVTVDRERDYYINIPMSVY
mgnify:CR=1 FL=1